MALDMTQGTQMRAVQLVCLPGTLWLVPADDASSVSTVFLLRGGGGSETMHILDASRIASPCAAHWGQPRLPCGS